MDPKTPNPCAGKMHRVTAAGAVAPHRWRCIVCERQFLTAPISVRVIDPPAAAAPGKPLEQAAAPDPEPLFVAVKSAVMAGGTHVATAISKTMAKRIADALNRAKQKRVS